MIERNPCDDVDAFKQFLALQAEEMQRHKWIESEKVGHDLGNYIMCEWVKTYAKQFRECYCKTLH